MFDLFIKIISLATEFEELAVQNNKNCRQTQYFFRNSINEKGIIGLYIVADELFGG